MAAASSACPANVAASSGAVIRTSSHVYNISVMNNGNKMKSKNNSERNAWRWRQINRAAPLVLVLVALVFMTIILTSCSTVQVEPVLKYGSNSDDNQGGVRLHIPF